MSVPFRIGVLQLSMEPLQQTVRMAQACERAGFDIFWLAEAYPWWRKHGMEARVMQDAAGDGRFLLGLGASKIFMKEIGEGEKGKDAGPAVVMRESIEIVTAMLEGK